MRVEQLELTNFRGIRQISLEFPTQTTVLVGINGVGKSAVLDAITLLLAEWVKGLAPSQTTGMASPRPQDVLNGAKRTRIALSVIDENQRFEWSTSARSGGLMSWIFPDEPMDAVEDLRRYIFALKKRLEQGTQTSLPVLVQYSTDRGMWSSAIDIEGNERGGFSPAAEPFAAYQGALPAGVGDFSAFIRWFKRREDLENERRARERPDFRDPQLSGVREAVETLMEGFSELKVERRLQRMTIIKSKEVLDIDQLSSGEKALLSVVADLARRLAIANPEAEQPRLGKGVVLIDEVDLHLHPRWQRKLIPSLERVFPNCQFIVTTHSPQVISEVKPECIYLLERTQEGEVIANRPEASFGLDSNRILEDLMGVDERPKRIKEQLSQFFRLIDEGKLDEAKALRRELETEIGSDEPSFAKGDVLIRRKEMLAGASHRPQR
jgi:predicted ATP-binding protein involved in virulence